MLLPSSAKPSEIIQINGRPCDLPTIILNYGADLPMKLLTRRVTLSQVVQSQSPKLGQLNAAFGTPATLGIIKLWLIKLNDFYPKGALSDIQLEELSAIIFSEYYFLTCTEVAFCFNQIKAGKYGEMYGDIDPLKITHSFAQFSTERTHALQRLDREQKTAQNAQKVAKWIAEAVDYNTAIRNFRRKRKKTAISALKTKKFKIKLKRKKL